MDSSGPPAGKVTCTTWGVGSRLLPYADGTTQSREQAAQFFEITAHAESLSQGSLDQALDGLVSALTAHVGHQLTDDVALVLAERPGDPFTKARGGRGTARPHRDQ